MANVIITDFEDSEKKKKKIVIIIINFNESWKMRIWKALAINLWIFFFYENWTSMVEGSSISIDLNDSS